MTARGGTHPLCDSKKVVSKATLSPYLSYILTDKDFIPLSALAIAMARAIAMACLFSFQRLSNAIHIP